MFKKITLGLLIASLTAIFVISVVSADSLSAEKQLPNSSPKPRGLVGMITEVLIDQFTIELPNGETVTILVTDQTVFRTRQSGEGSEASFSDLSTGMWVAVHQRRDGDGNPFARLVVLLPDDFDPSTLRGKRALGIVEKINPGQNTFEITTRAVEGITFQVDERTRFAGGIESFDDLEKDMVVAVAAVKQADSSLLAKVVAAKPQDRPALLRTGGKISQIRGDSISILTRQGEEQTFTITETTRFASHQGDIHSIEDLELDMIVVVITRPDSDQAAAVLVVDHVLLKLERVTGIVQSAGGNHLTINVNDQKLGFTVDENT